MSDFAKIPAAAKLNPVPFTAHIDDEKLKQLKELIKLSRVGPATFENTNTGRQFGTQREWLINAKKEWESFDWRKHEDRINSYPNFKVDVTDDEGITINVHFIALFSERQDAIPLTFLHGWPGSFLEFFDILDILKSRYSAKNLPYHIIVPSLPGYGYSSAPPLDKDYDMQKATSCINNLMTGLGFNAYLAQGGDLGSMVCYQLSLRFEACKGTHVNMWLGAPQKTDGLPLDDDEKAGLQGGAHWRNTGSAYALEHGTRSATIGLALNSNPIAMLSWIGEKFLAWSDEDPPLDRILESVTLYWLTETFETGMWAYRGQNRNKQQRPQQASLEIFSAGSTPMPYQSKPTGYSFFPKELFPAPGSWVKEMANIVFFKKHTGGGHFAAMERPKELLADVEEWIPKAWKPESGKL